MGGDAQQPGGKPGLAAKPVEVLQRAQKRLLGEVLMVGGSVRSYPPRRNSRLSAGNLAAALKIRGVSYSAKSGLTPEGVEFPQAALAVRAASGTVQAWRSKAT